MTKILCWFGFHPWAYGYNHRGHIDERRCYRCKTRQAPYDETLGMAPRYRSARPEPAWLAAHVRGLRERYEVEV